MATNNYFGFTHGGTQYSAAAAAATGAAYQAGQASYAVAPAPAAAGYGTQRAATGYDTTYQAAATQSTYAAVGYTTTGSTYGYGRAGVTGYDASKTYYQQAAAGQTQGYPTAAGYDQSAAPKTAYNTTAYAQRTTAQAQAQPQDIATIQANQYAGGYQANATGYQAATYAQPAAQTTVTAQPVTQAKQATNSSTTYSGYDAALYSAATMYVAQQSTGTTQTSGGKSGNWQGYKKGSGAGGKNMRPKPPPKPQQLHYCDVCKISCAGPQTYREHLEGQKHKKREASLKLTASVNVTNQNRAGNSLRCQLCDVTCTGNDAYAAHIRGSKHQKVVMLHTKLGKPIPPTEPEVIGGGTAKKTVSSTPKINFVASGGLGMNSNNGSQVKEDEQIIEEMPEPDIQPVGQDYIEEIKNEEGKVISFNCKLCECRFNDPNAKEMHMKGRRHRLQYKKKVNPDLVVDVKPSMRTRKIHEEKMRRQYWQRRHMAAAEAEEEDRLYWEERRRYEEDYLEWCRRGAMGPFPPGRGRPPFGAGGPPPPPSFFQGGPMRHHQESNEDRHVLARHAEIYPKEDELQSIQRIVSHTERALKIVSDQLADNTTITTKPSSITTNINNSTPIVITTTATVGAVAVAATSPVTAATTTAAQKDVIATTTTVAAEIKETVTTATATTTAMMKEEQKCQPEQKEDGRDNQLFSFQKEERDANRVLKGVMRVGHLAKGLLLRGDNKVQLVVLCADKPTLTLLRRVVELLPAALKAVSAEHTYTVTLNAADAGLTVSGEGLEVMASLTSPVMREQEAAPAASSGTDRDVLARGKCLQALAALRHTKWFQARALGLHSCVVIIRILRDLCQRVPTWAPLNSWAMELLVEKVISSVGQVQLGPGDALRRLMEAVAGGILLPGGPGLADPCEKDTPDAAGAFTPQQREDITCSAQYALRLIAYRQIYKVLGMDPLPAPKFMRHDRSLRKRRHSDAEGGDSCKVTKKDGEADSSGESVKIETPAVVVTTK